MQNTHEKPAASFLLRLRSRDTPTSISAATLDTLVNVTGMSKTELVHLALRNLADQYLPHYERDDGPLTHEQIAAIHKASEASTLPDSVFTQSLI
ncbi:hypothetical protein LGZ99_00910 [Photorhabdus temperata]|uniref:Uncharacterized protein n=2 Tax=Photorhabdus temperata TaxID=574560 RepID=A0A081S1C3_PHOTE|nr:hypothetical protein [Photorhabdus temperata]EQB99285.1 hypothetical protein B738_18610 [Photorhabdus temperata subsp. temperata M1021]ERT12162.1 hypothetical protein O185_15405 [Photorhabdus temperata J3]KER04726.1 hypothetical protein MEG1DRAFT_00510 [Photorhabdus temperata subsp. temperata Meg1]MCT8345813.1 hypothetical protein [Photorhabdus temperata]